MYDFKISLVFVSLLENYLQVLDNMMVSYFLRGDSTSRYALHRRSLVNFELESRMPENNPSRLTSQHFSEDVAFEPASLPF